MHPTGQQKVLTNKQQVNRRLKRKHILTLVENKTERPSLLGISHMKERDTGNSHILY